MIRVAVQQRTDRLLILLALLLWEYWSLRDWDRHWQLVLSYLTVTLWIKTLGSGHYGQHLSSHVITAAGQGNNCRWLSWTMAALSDNGCGSELEVPLQAMYILSVNWDRDKTQEVWLLKVSRDFSSQNILKKENHMRSVALLFQKWHKAFHERTTSGVTSAGLHGGFSWFSVQRHSFLLQLYKKFVKFLFGAQEELLP